jgi:6-pyruvoyltetrahydropterin/6-carboxytetrahydropterin synthase
MIYCATKTYGHDLGLSVAFRQWRADSHCRYIHGYAIAVRLTFEASSLDARGWVIDFGSLKPVKAMLQTTFDHVLLVAEDDPQREWFLEAQRRDIAQVFVVERTGCEAFAALIHGVVSDWLKSAGHYPRVRLTQVDVMEHGANAAYVVHDEDQDGR